MTLRKQKTQRRFLTLMFQRPLPSFRIAAIYPSMRIFSTYIPMRDGVRLAADIYLPDPLPRDTRLPTILEQTRYWLIAAQTA